MIETGLPALLMADPDVAALVSDRVYPMLLPTGFTPPGVTWQIVAGQTKPGLTTRGMQRWRKKLFLFLARNSQYAASSFGIPPSRVMEVGGQVEI